MSPRGKEIRGIVRIAGKDVKGEVSLRRAVIEVKGVGERYGRIIFDAACSKMGFPLDCMVGELSEDELDRLEEIMKNPASVGIPSFLMNRRKDVDTGQDKQLIATDLVFQNKQDVEREKGMSSWRGYRHVYGKKVRGQRTRTTGRKGMSVGVLRKSLVAKPGAAPAKEEKK
ncbi:30S ribosomal protein S13 [Candidatus Micrarchaeota archaeon]|nr:30S ribosomal protein S13 [Candidatus Micrarchaeota archaeon]